MQFKALHLPSQLNSKLIAPRLIQQKVGIAQVSHDFQQRQLIISEATKKGSGSSKNGRHSTAHYRGIKKSMYQVCKSGEILVTQNGYRVDPGTNVSVGRDYTLNSLIDGMVIYGVSDRSKRQGTVRKRQVHVYPFDHPLVKDRLEKVTKWPDPDDYEIKKLSYHQRMLIRNRPFCYSRIEACYQLINEILEGMQKTDNYYERKHLAKMGLQVTCIGDKNMIKAKENTEMSGPLVDPNMIKWYLKYYDEVAWAYNEAKEKLTKLVPESYFEHKFYANELAFGSIHTWESEALKAL